MGWQTQVAVQLQAGNTIINPDGTFVYSGAPAAGNLIITQAPAPGTDQFGNQYLDGVVTYGSGVATQLVDGGVAMLLGSLSTGWTIHGQVVITAGGNVELLTDIGSVVTTNNTLDNGAGNATFNGNVTITGTLSVNGSTNTGNKGLTDGTINGTSGGASAGTAHTHGPGSFAVTNGQHNHAL